MLSALRSARRGFATAASKSEYRVVVVGGGAAGVTVAAKLANSPGFAGAKDICVVEPSAVHAYQPMWTLVGAGIKNFNESVRPEADVIPHAVGWAAGHRRGARRTNCSEWSCSGGLAPIPRH